MMHDIREKRSQAIAVGQIEMSALTWQGGKGGREDRSLACPGFLLSQLWRGQEGTSAAGAGGDFPLGFDG